MLLLPLRAAVAADEFIFNLVILSLTARKGQKELGWHGFITDGARGEGKKKILISAYKVLLGLKPFRGYNCGSPTCCSSKLEPFSSKHSSRIHLKPPVVPRWLFGLERRSRWLFTGLLLPLVAFGDSDTL